MVAIYPFSFEGEGNTKQTTQYFESRSLDIIKISNDDYGNAPFNDGFLLISLQIFQSILSYLDWE